MAPRTTSPTSTNSTTSTTGYLNATQLAARGWTPAMIRDFLGAPDRTEFIPRFRQSAPTLLFELSRVQAAERTEKFVQRLEVAARRSAVAKQAAHRRRVELLRLMSADEIPIPKLAPDVLADRAIRHREPRKPVAAAGADSNTLNRWKVNYLRHELTRYDSMIEGLFGRVGRAAAEKLLLRRVLEAIGKTYPDLLDECQRQLRVSERTSRSTATWRPSRPS
ncbi:hypothetical protein [Catenulispora rubra]|uniref:hypothetical protein n=1 Tax=Catenulispora rubra TaxID=280293 RepID=UPI001891FBA6|nr:hypothetical protein [Catenulispora rubra]